MGGRADACPKADSPPISQGARALIERGRGLHAEIIQSDFLKFLEIGHQWSDLHHLDCFRDS